MLGSEIVHWLNTHVCNLGCVIPMAISLATVVMLLSVVISSSTASYLAWRWWCSSYDCGRQQLARLIEGAAVLSEEIVPASASSYY